MKRSDIRLATIASRVVLCALAIGSTSVVSLARATPATPVQPRPAQESRHVDPLSRVMVADFGGERGAEVAQRLRAGLAASAVTLVAIEASRGLDSRSDASLLREFAVANHASYLVSGQVAREMDGWAVTLMVMDAGTGRAGEQRLSARSLPGLMVGIEQQALSLVAGVLVQPAFALAAADPPTAPATAGSPVAPAAAVADEPVAPVPRDVSETQPAAQSSGATAVRERDVLEPNLPAGDTERQRLVLQVRAGLGVTVRNLRYRDPIADANNRPLEEHDGLGVALPFAEAEWYPFARLPTTVLANLGVSGRFARSLGGNTAAFGSEFNTYEQELLMDARYRVPMGRHLVTLVAGWGAHELRIQGDSGLGGSDVPGVGVLPDVSYSFARFGVEGALRISSRWELDGRFMVRLPSLGAGTGELASASWFPDASAKGFEAQLASDFAAQQGFGLRAGVSYRQYGYNMNVTTDGAFEGTSTTRLAHAVAGGAVDSFLGLFAAGTYSLIRTKRGGHYAKAY